MNDSAEVDKSDIKMVVIAAIVHNAKGGADKTISLDVFKGLKKFGNFSADRCENILEKEAASSRK